jgi:hypothetical protein
MLECAPELCFVFCVIPEQKSLEMNVRRISGDVFQPKKFE